MIEVLLPDIGDFHDVEIIEIPVKPGDRVEVEDPLLTLESDKASIEIPSPQAGVVGELKVSLGDKVNQGDLLMMLDVAAAEPASQGDEAAPGEAEAVEPVESVPESAQVSVDGPAPAAGQPVVRDVLVPDIGDFKDVEIIEVLVQAGDPIEPEQSLLTLESDKASMEIPAPFGGVVKSIAVKLGDKLNEGDLIASVETAVPAPAAAPPVSASAAEEAVPAAAPAET
ncbi:MAG: biotin/lipoyl-containing protein, partial [Sedimenticolaceae bacterium]